MPKQPTWEDLGPTPGVAGARPVGSYDVDAYARGAQKIANAGERFGASVARLGKSEAEFAARRARREITAAQTQAITGLIGLRSQYAADPDFTTVKQRWTDDAAKIVDDPAGLISSEPARLAEILGHRNGYNGQLQRWKLSDRAASSLSAASTMTTSSDSRATPTT